MLSFKLFSWSKLGIGPGQIEKEKAKIDNHISQLL